MNHMRERRLLIFLVHASGHIIKTGVHGSPTCFAFTACLAVNRAQFTVANTGGTSLSWSASAGSSGYTVSPTSGSLTPGQSVVVTVSTILVSGTVKISAPGALNVPQQVTITCKL